MDEPTYLSSSSETFFLSNSWLTVSLLVLLLGLTVEYKRANDINELMSEQLKNLRRDYEQLKMHDTDQQLQILTELRALRDCGPPKTIDKPKEVESKTVENEPEAVEIKPEPEHLETKIIEEPKTVVEPQPMDIQETTVVEAKPIDEPNNEQKLNDEPNGLSCSKECVGVRNIRHSIVEFCSFAVSNPINIIFSICNATCLYIWSLLCSFLSNCYCGCLSIWKILTIDVILTVATTSWCSVLPLKKIYEENNSSLYCLLNLQIS
ncbi:hypothetical protein M3Y98_00910600 [Aphelenchoides besseyi]|nr:hypothetical protein M3Y98_00910600 [Aphelenchoides besseyi]